MSDQDDEEVRRGFESDVNTLSSAEVMKNNGFRLYTLSETIEIRSIHHIEIGVIYYTQEHENKVFRNSSTEVQVSNQDLGETVSIPVPALSDKDRKQVGSFITVEQKAPESSQASFSFVRSQPDVGKEENLLQAEIYLEQLTGQKLANGIELRVRDSSQAILIYSLDEIYVGMRYVDALGHRISKTASGSFIIHTNVFQSLVNQITPIQRDDPLAEQEDIEYFDNRMRNAAVKRAERCQTRLNEYMEKYQSHYSISPAAPLLDSVDDDFHTDLMNSDYVLLLKQRCFGETLAMDTSADVGKVTAQYRERFKTVKSQTEELFITSPLSKDRKLGDTSFDSAEDCEAFSNNEGVQTSPQHPQDSQLHSNSLLTPLAKTTQENHPWETPITQRNHKHVGQATKQNLDNDSWDFLGENEDQFQFTTQKRDTDTWDFLGDSDENEVIPQQQQQTEPSQNQQDDTWDFLGELDTNNKESQHSTTSVSSLTVQGDVSNVSSPTKKAAHFLSAYKNSDFSFQAVSEGGDTPQKNEVYNNSLTATPKSDQSGDSWFGLFSLPWGGSTPQENKPKRKRSLNKKASIFSME